jgi:murein L,D-transpeptidase YcbB/YkuD
MEQLRWLPSDFGRRHVFINQPAYTASYVVDGKANLSMRAIVGTPANQTSFFYDTIEVVEVNPYWNVPRSILQNEMLGKIRNDPGYLSARNYEVVSNNGKPQDPYSINWNSASGPNDVYVRQRPGGSNALGELKILFPNKHAIYMHDTPSRNLFQRSSRALSHGCIRLHKPRDMAAAVLQTSVEQVGSYISGGQNKTIKVENQLPVYVSYFTAWPEDDGSIGYHTDIYGRDDAVTKALDATSALRERITLTAS